MNTIIGGHRADVLFIPDRLIVELDWGTHDTPWAGEDDKDRDADIYAELAIPTIRITQRQLTRDPKKQATRVLKILERR
jgi:very-short-patch-repair endonuclease